jgi:hypothetical protein
VGEAGGRPISERDDHQGRSWRHDTFLCTALFIGTVVLFLPATRNWFISYDDQFYIYSNPDVQAGLTRGTFVWAFTTFDAANWHPLTWLSIALDCQLFGLNPAGHHLTSILIHAANAVLVFVLMRNSTGRAWTSALAAAFFAWHPLRAESVAWAAERKDVLSGFFFLLVLLAYSSNIKRPSSWKLLAVYAAFIAALLAKPMIVTLPFVLLLWDYWPLRRREGMVRLVVEKLPMLALSAGSCVVTVIAQRAGGAVHPMGDYGSVCERVLDAFHACAWYVFKEAYPAHLSVLYPIRKYPFSETVPAAVFIAAISAGVIASRRTFRPLFVGWAWFLGMLVPVIGIVRVGSLSMADRYTYLPGIGLAIILAWTMARWAQRARGVAIVTSIVVLAACAVLTFHHLGTWYDTESVYTQAMAASEDNELARASIPRGRLERAEREYYSSPGQPASGWKQGDSSWDFFRRLTPEQRVHYFQIIRGQLPGSAQPHIKLGEEFIAEGDIENALVQFGAAVQIAPTNAVAQAGLAKSLVKLRRIDEGIDHARRALAADPHNAAAAAILAEYAKGAFPLSRYSARGKG